MQLVCLMPTIHFRPAESRKKSAKGGKLPPPPPLSSPQMHLPRSSRLQSLSFLFFFCPFFFFLSFLFLSLTVFSFPLGMYSCPCYYYPNRAGSADRASFVIGIDLRSGAMTSDHWIKRGTALLMSLDN